MIEGARPGRKTENRPTRDRATLVTLFERQARKHPGRIALTAGDQQITYRQLESRTNQLARMLVSQGASPEDCIALLFDRSPELIVALLATLKAGAAYLPLDPGAPPARLSALVGDARPRFALTTTELMPRLSSTGLMVLCVDEPSTLEAGARPRTALTDRERRGAPAALASGLHHLHIGQHRGSQGRSRQPPECHSPV